MLAPSSRQRYRRVLTKAGCVPQQHVMILWNTDPAVGEVEVNFVRRDAATEAPDNPWYGFDDYAAEWDNSAGNRSSGWLTTKSHTPAAVFGQLMAARLLQPRRHDQRARGICADRGSGLGTGDGGGVRIGGADGYAAQDKAITLTILGKRDQQPSGAIRI